MTVDDVGREHMRCVGIRVAKKVGKAHGWQRVFIAKTIFVELNHDLEDDLMISDFSWQMKIFKSSRSG